MKSSLTPAKTSFQMTIACSLALIGILGYGYVYLKISALNNEVALDRSVLSASSASNQSASEAAQTLATTTSERSALLSEFVPGNGAAEAIDTLENFGRSLGLSVSTASVSQQQNPQDPATPPISQQLLIQISTEGSWGANATYLAELENLPYFSFITNYSLNETIDQKGVPTGVWDGSINVVLIQLN